ncbi:hypothetical protein QFZ75_008049 [Streptomyces sp. V3I8]|uniref:hypothetical protein n=1 Tax=Streptomyces sp. V3I8 TaxID=3042279 RepID=UPI0027826B7B|nr:hypothetical protein [Streptomyces sp. V3I8]MDQ1041547.1 hypothetical protein [Streptomyces sp. V3I8]
MHPEPYSGPTAAHHITEGQRALRQATEASSPVSDALRQEALAHFAAAQAINGLPAPAATEHEDLSDEELLASAVGTRMRKILYDRMHEYSEERYQRSTKTGTASAIMGGIELARNFVYPEVNEDGFRNAAEWDEPYTPTEADRAELRRRIKEHGGIPDHGTAETMAMEIADERLAEKGV